MNVVEAIRRAIGDYFRQKNRCYLSGDVDPLLELLDEKPATSAIGEVRRLHESAQNRGIVYKKSDMQIVVNEIIPDQSGDGAVAIVTENVLWLYEHHGELEEEQRATRHRLWLHPEGQSWLILKDQPEEEARHRLHSPSSSGSLPREQGGSNSAFSKVASKPAPEGAWVRPELTGSSYERDWRKTSYDRVQAVRYAEVWWNSYNPAYRSFEVDCTNFTSQCLRAGGAPFVGGQRRDRGWWYRGGTSPNWSYSWAVANSFKWFLGSDHPGWRAIEVGDPRQLMVGDVICYDWEGDGRWTHSTTIVDFDATGMPLVNAHTVNSRRRYWDYSNSYAFTPKTKYAFYHIPDAF